MQRFVMLQLCALAVALAPVASGAAEPLTLTLGDSAAGRAELEFKSEMTGSDAFVLRTVRVGAPGSILTISIDRAADPLLSHTFAADDCSFATGEAVCEVAVPGRSATYNALVAAFKAGATAHLTVETSGLMSMQTDTSLRGFTRAFSRL